MLGIWTFLIINHFLSYFNSKKMVPLNSYFVHLEFNMKLKICAIKPKLEYDYQSVLLNSFIMAMTLSNSPGCLRFLGPVTLDKFCKGLTILLWHVVCSSQKKLGFLTRMVRMQSTAVTNQWIFSLLVAPKSG